MTFKLTDVLSSKTTTIVLLCVYALLMGTATILEKFQGTLAAKALIYHSPLFIFLHLLMIVNFLLLTLKMKLVQHKKWTNLLLHGAFIVIMTGAMVTHLFGQEGTLHLREGEKTAHIIVKNGETPEVHYLPFEIELTDFRLTRYPGSMSPSSYESDLKIYVDGEIHEEKVYMNNVLDLKGYRFFQAHYDADELGSVLAVNHDATGRYITYTGYLLLFAGLLLLLLDKDSRFRRLWKQLKYVMLPALFLLNMGNVQAQNLEVSAEHAAKWGALPMQSPDGRIIPVNTFAEEVVRKLKAEKVIGPMNPEQFLLSLLAYPADWSVIPLVEINDEEIGKAYGWNQERISYRDAFDATHRYLLYEEMEAIYMKNPAERTRRDKELLKIDDRINLLHVLLTNRMLRLFPNPADSLQLRWVAMGEVTSAEVPVSETTSKEIIQLSTHYLEAVKAAMTSHQWKKADQELTAIANYQQQNVKGNLIDEGRLQAEIFYNQMNLPRLCKIGYLVLGAILVILAFKLGASKERPSWKQWMVPTIFGGVVILFLLHTLSLGLRWYISGYAPWSNSYETMVALAWAGVFCGFIFARRNLLVTALATLFGGAILFVSSLNWMDPQITPLVPVLKSPWLMAHVASLVMAYGFLGISCMIGTAYLLLTVSKKEETTALRSQLTIINELSMTSGLGFLTVGIFLGAIWANESWGRYWSWDPKETWALITMVVYATVLHVRWFMKGNSDQLFNLLSQWAVLSILMTFLGVNYFLSGMHSYGSHDALAGIPWWAYLLFFTFFVVPGVISKLFDRK